MFFFGFLKRPQHISKIVEYFERKQVGSGISTCNGGIGSRWEWKDVQQTGGKISSSGSLHPQLRRNWLHQQQTDIGNQNRSLDYYTRRKLFEKPFSAAAAGGSHVFSKRSVNQRLIVCEGAVKSKLQLFDKKKSSS